MRGQVDIILLDARQTCESKHRGATLLTVASLRFYPATVTAFFLRLLSATIGNVKPRNVLVEEDKNPHWLGTIQRTFPISRPAKPGGRL